MKLLLFFFKRFLLENFRYSVDLADIAGLILIGAFGITSILGIRNNYILARLAVKINRFFAASI